MKNAIIINEADTKQRLKIFKRFLTELKLWTEWKKYINTTGRRNRWLDGIHIISITRNVDFSAYLMNKVYRQLGIDYFYFTTAFEIFLFLFTNYESRAYGGTIKSYLKRNTYCNSDSFIALRFLEKRGVLDRWIKESPNFKLENVNNI